MIEEMYIPNMQVKWSLTFLWLIGIAFAGIVGWFLAIVVALLSLGIGGIFAGGIWGFFVGGVQRELLRRYLQYQDWSRSDVCLA